MGGQEECGERPERCPASNPLEELRLREAGADSGVIFQFLVPHCSLPTSSPPSPACCLKGSCVIPTGVPPSLGKMPFGLSAGSTGFETGNEAFLEGMGNSYDPYFTYSFSQHSQFQVLCFRALGIGRSFRRAL